MYHAESEASVQDGAMQYLINNIAKMGPGVGNGNPLLYSCLKNFMTEEPGRLQSMGSNTVSHDWATDHLEMGNSWTDSELILWSPNLLGAPELNSHT